MCDVCINCYKQHEIYRDLVVGRYYKVTTRVHPTPRILYTNYIDGHSVMFHIIGKNANVTTDCITSAIPLQLPLSRADASDINSTNCKCNACVGAYSYKLSDYVVGDCCILVATGEICTVTMILADKLVVKNTKNENIVITDAYVIAPKN